MSPKGKMRKVGSCESFRESILLNKAASCGVHMDSTLGALEESRYKKKHADLIRRLSLELRLTTNEIEQLVLIYYKFQREANNREHEMTRVQFREVLHSAFDMTNDEINAVVIYVLDKSPNQNVCMEAWVRSLSLFLRGTFEQKIDYCYSVYDAYGTGVIPRNNMLHLMSGAIQGDDNSDDVIRDLFDLICNKMDKDRDGKISYQDFRDACIEEPLMMEPFGQCLPSRLAAHAFRTTFTHYSGTYY